MKKTAPPPAAFDRAALQPERESRSIASASLLALVVVAICALLGRALALAPLF